jgi:hypothetical protein
VFAYTSTETKVNIQYSFAVIHDNNMATKPKLRTLAEERIPMLSSPAGIATWKKEMSLLATQISPDLGRLFDGTARIDCLPKPPQTTDTFPEACGGGLRYPSGATSRKYTDAVEQYLEKMDNFAKEEKQLFAKMLYHSSTQRVAAADKSNNTHHLHRQSVVMTASRSSSTAY